MLYSLYAMNSMESPTAMLIDSNIPIILIVSLKSLFLSKTNKPNPALERSPLIAAPKLIVPFISIIVIATDIAQFGIKPIIDETIICIYLYPEFAIKFDIGMLCIK